MNRTSARPILFLILLILSSSCLPVGTDRTGFQTSGREISRAIPSVEVVFEDRTEEIVRHAELLTAENEREGAVLDQRWYTLKRFGPHQDLIFAASQIVFYGGLESDVRREIHDRYRALVPVEDQQDTGDIRLFRAERERAPPDVIIIGQNGREVALKTVIRLLYLARFADDEPRQKYGARLASFAKSLRVFSSSLGAKAEFSRFFDRHGISHPDVVMIGFIGNIRAILGREGMPDPQTFSDESLRVNWYSDAGGKKLLLVSIDGNRIFGSRAGALIEAILERSGSAPPSITFLGSGGAIDEPEIVGKLVSPTVVLNGDPFPAAQGKGALAHIIRNRALDETSIRAVHASVESVVVETTQWARRMKMERVRTVDQELFHVIGAINSSPAAHEIDVFAGILVTDNISPSVVSDLDITLREAEGIIATTFDLRTRFFSTVLSQLGLLNQPRMRSSERQSMAR
jgi:hypothetical protein